MNVYIIFSTLVKDLRKYTSSDIHFKVDYVSKYEMIGTHTVENLIANISTYLPKHRAQWCRRSSPFMYLFLTVQYNLHKLSASHDVQLSFV